MSAVKRYSTNEAYAELPYGTKVTLATDFDALAAECEALRLLVDPGHKLALDAACGEIALLQAEVARLRGDAERLNWLIAQDLCVIQEGSEGFWIKWIDEFDLNKSEFQEGMFETARAALDAAMAKEPRDEP